MFTCGLIIPSSVKQNEFCLRLLLVYAPVNHYGHRPYPMILHFATFLAKYIYRLSLINSNITKRFELSTHLPRRAVNRSQIVKCVETVSGGLSVVLPSL